MTFASIYHASIETKVVLLYMEGNKINQSIITKTTDGASNTKMQHIIEIILAENGHFVFRGLLNRQSRTLMSC